jgi:hypothetical protein
VAWSAGGVRFCNHEVKRDIVITLQEVSAFVGMRPLSMHGVGDLIPILSDDAKTSMQAMIRELQSLPAITLEAEAVGDRFGDAPFRPTFRIHPSPGAVTKTEIIIFANGTQPDLHSIVGNSGDFTPFTLTIPGVFLLEIRRTGVQSTGVVILTKSFHIETVQPPSPPKPPLVHPVISVISSGGGTFTVTGSGFLHDVPVHIRVVDPAHQNDQTFTTKSDASGNVTGFKTPNICVQAGPIFFSANDERTDPDDHPLGILFSNTVPMTCPG